MSKTRTPLIGAALIAAIALSVPAGSALAKGGAGFGGMGGAAALEFEHFDQNGDGSLTPEEMRDLGKARFARMVDRLDTDGNGTVSAAEMEAGHDKMRKGGKMGKAHARGDKARGGKDGGEHRRADRDGARGGAGFDRLFALIDTDGNGSVSEAEFDSAKERLAARRPGNAPAPTEN